MTTSDRLSLDGADWLAAATGAGLPEPVQSRWQPLRVGVVNLWEYDHAEFWFADGRLVLRGGNGAGKTKVLELTTLLLLRGDIHPTVLDPFASQARLMRYNLLPSGEADDPRPPADAGLGYAWVEFGRRDDDGAAQYFTCGLGASIRRGSGTATPATWHLVTRLRPGKDFAFVEADRPLSEKDLRTIDGIWVPPNAAGYRERIAHELFGIDSAEAYDNLTELLKQLRRPKLGERLNPASLAGTLRESLPALASGEINQLAEGWEHLEELRDAVEKTAAAATAVATFVRNGWQPWARIVVRRRADDLAAAITRFDDTTKARREAERRLSEAAAQVSEAEQLLADHQEDERDRASELTQLIESDAFRDAVSAAGRVEELRGTVESLRSQLAAAESRQVADAADLEAAEAAARKAANAVSDADQEAARRVGVVNDAAAPAGLAVSAARHLPSRDLAALRSDHRVRTERFRHLRRLHGALADADLQVGRQELLLAERVTDRDTAVSAETVAVTDVQTAVDTFVQQVRAWAGTARVTAVEPTLVADWCDAAAGLTAYDEETGTVLEAPSVSQQLGIHVESTRRRLREERTELRTRRVPLTEQYEDLVAELEAVRSTTESAPPEPLKWRRQRPATGAPLWRCVQPVDGMAGDSLDRLEATLAAAGLLDAWISPDGLLQSEDGSEVLDTQLLARTPPAGRNLAEVLEPETSAEVGTDVIRRVMAGVGWRDERPSTAEDHLWIAADGTWRVGGLTGRTATAGPASYLGATARAAARRRRIADLERRIGEVEERLAALDGQLNGLTVALDAADREHDSIPSDHPVTASVSILAARAKHRGDCARKMTEAQVRHDHAIAARDLAQADFAGYASQNNFPLDDLDQVGEAMQRYHDALNALAAAVDKLELLRSAATGAEAVETAARNRLRKVADEVAGLAVKLREATIKHRAAQQALGRDHRQTLDRRHQLDREVEQLRAVIKLENEKVTTAKVEQETARGVLIRHEEMRAAAEQLRNAALREWWSIVDAGLVAPLGFEVPDRRNQEAALVVARGARRDLTPAVEPQLEDRAWRRCVGQLNELRQALLPNRDARVVDDAEAPIQRIEILADQAAGWQPPRDASETLVAQVASQQQTYDAEQQEVLTTLLGSTFIEHLKDRLDYAQHTFAGINQKLAKHPTRQGHAVHLAWSADPTDPDAHAVVDALRQGYHLLGPERQEMVRSFLARKIDEARAVAEAEADWKDELATALDYRRWLRIAVEYRSGPTSKWKAFDAALHAAKSGGEKVVLLSQPLFAAAVVAFDAAGPSAPRWVWLDEAMTGVDATQKASFMGLTAEFELDLMLTAHDEWCTYDTVPAVAIYDLSRHQHLPGVDVVPYLWCGGQRTRVAVDRLGVRLETPPPGDPDLFSTDED